MITLDQIDEMTPKYKRLMDSLPLAHRKVIGALTRLPVPAGATEIAREARLEPRKASMALTRLKAKGIVSHQNRKWELADPLLGTWYRARRRGRLDSTADDRLSG